MFVRKNSAQHAKQAKSPLIWRRDWGFSAVDCGPETFLRYGICGDCEVACRDGMTKIKRLTPSHRIITRHDGFVSPVALLNNQFDHRNIDEQRRIGISTGALGDGLPQQFIVLGAKNKVSRYIKDPQTRRPSVVSLEFDTVNDAELVKNCASGELCVPVFAESVEISIAGVYVRCPTIYELTKRTRLS